MQWTTGASTRNRFWIFIRSDRKRWCPPYPRSEYLCQWHWSRDWSLLSWCREWNIARCTSVLLNVWRSSINEAKFWYKIFESWSPSYWRRANRFKRFWVGRGWCQKEIDSLRRRRHFNFNGILRDIGFSCRNLEKQVLFSPVSYLFTIFSFRRGTLGLKKQKLTKRRYDANGMAKIPIRRLCFQNYIHFLSLIQKASLLILRFAFLRLHEWLTYEPTYVV